MYYPQDQLRERRPVLRPDQVGDPAPSSTPRAAAEAALPDLTARGLRGVLG
jgi:hypothetical protein